MEDDSQEGLSQRLIKGFQLDQSQHQEQPPNVINIRTKREIQGNKQSVNQQASQSKVEVAQTTKKLMNAESQIDLEEFYVPQEQPGNSRETLGQSKNPQPAEEILHPEESQGSSNQKGNRSKKNLIKYIAVKSANIMFQHRGPFNLMKDKCKRSNINHKQFEAQFTKIIKKITGLQNLVQLFIVDKEKPKDAVMKSIFESVFIKILRKRYMIYLLRKGKMRMPKTDYIEIKNQKLAYLLSHIRSVMEKPNT